MFPNKTLLSIDVPMIVSVLQVPLQFAARQTPIDSFGLLLVFEALPLLQQLVAKNFPFDPILCVVSLLFVPSVSQLPANALSSDIHLPGAAIVRYEFP